MITRLLSASVNGIRLYFGQLDKTLIDDFYWTNWINGLFQPVRLSTRPAASANGSVSLDVVDRRSKHIQASFQKL